MDALFPGAPWPDHTRTSPLVTYISSPEGSCAHSSPVSTTCLAHSCSGATEDTLGELE